MLFTSAGRRMTSARRPTADERIVTAMKRLPPALRAWCAGWLLMLLASLPAFAQGLGPALERFKADSFADTEAAIAAVASSASRGAWTSSTR